MAQVFQILVMDDEALLRMAVAMAFEDEGYLVETAANGAEALVKVAERRPDLIVFDLMMPSMNGWDFVETWREIPGCQHVPIVVISAAHARPEQRDIDVQTFFPKPFDLDTLLATAASPVAS